ncbi:MAG: hypothetical protein M1376_02720 [Planctomycetes bacterium]|nr:hypothetical protein [Planctomycetota bacterium]
MNSTVETSTTETRHTRPVLCAFLGFIIVALAVTVLPRLGSAVGQYRSAKKQEMAATDMLEKAAGDKIQTIKEMGLSEYARRTNATASRQDSAGSCDDSSDGPQRNEDAVLEQKIRQELENSVARQNLGWHCTRVRLAQCDANTYLGLAEFDKTKPLAFELMTDGYRRSFGFSRLLSRADWEKEFRNARQDKQGAKAEPDSARSENTPGTSVGRGKSERQTPLGDDDIKRLRMCQIGYVTEVGLAAAGISFGEFTDRLSRSQISPPVLTQSTDGQTVVTIKEGTKTTRLFFTCDPTGGACVIAGGEINGDEIDSYTAMAIMIGLTGQ